MPGLTNFSPDMREQIYKMQVTEARKHLNELLKDSAYEAIFWDIFFEMVMKKYKKLEKKHPLKAYRALKKVYWFFELKA